MKYFLGRYYFGLTTHQSIISPVKDFDYYKFSIPSTGILNLSIYSIATPVFTIDIKNSSGITVYSFNSTGKSYLSISAILQTGNYTLILSGIPTTSSYKYPYSFKLEHSPITNFCYGTTYLTNSTGSLSDGSGNNNYSNNSDCRWRIQPAGASSITLNFTEFNIVAPGDTLFVFDGPSINAPLLGALTGTLLPPNITSSTGIIFLWFKTDNSLASTGWSLNYISVITPVFCHNTTILNTNTGSFSDGSGLDFYRNNTRCSWLINPPNTNSINLSFQSFKTELNTDFVRVYDGPDNTSTLIGSFSGMALPPEITSSGGALFLEFITNQSDSLEGWSASYSTLSSTSEKSIVAYEYWFNGYTNSVVTEVVPQENLILNTSLPTNQLVPGLHTINIRFKYLTGIWSSVSTYFFYKPKLDYPVGSAMYQYWFDNHFQNKVDSVITNTPDLHLTNEFDLSNLTLGLHSVQFRFKLNSRNWSSIISTFFYKSPSTAGPISGYQYWFNNSYTDAINHSFQGVNNYILLNELNTSSVSYGLSTLNIRFKNTAGIWGSIISNFIYKPKPSANAQNKIIAYRYWIDTLLNNITTVNLSTPISDFLLLDNICTSVTSFGEHNIHFQFLDSTSLWSSVLSSTFTKTATSNPVITVNGSNTICQGGSVTLTSSPGTSYLWNTGATTQSIIVNTAGNYFVLVNNGSGCSLSSDTVIITTTTAPVQPGLISGNNQVCQGSSQTYSIAAVPGASSYTWILPSGWTGSSTTNSIAVTAGISGGNILVRANNTCGSSPDRTLAVTVNVVPGQPGTITGNSVACQGSAQTYSVAPVSGASGYNWTLPAGWSGSSATNSISVTAGSTGGNILVSANNACGNSLGQSLNVTVNNVPLQPGSITGNAIACQGSSQTYSIAAVSGATNYTWILPAGWTGSSTTNSISVTAGATGGNILVRANNSCGSSADQTISITVNTAPGQPGAITGSNTVCQDPLRHIQLQQYPDPQIIPGLCQPDGLVHPLQIV